ncbi:hypothetical protein A6C57_23500 [Fibrella sp. ES10-3-2-2]|nr:hypothetical protein A6C57_23500 [Fibrella sp. ES10-3-2-2]
MKLSLQSIVLLVALLMALAYGVSQCSRANKAERTVSELQQANRSLIDQRQIAYNHADSIIKQGNQSRQHIAQVVAALSPSVRTQLNRQLLADFNKADTLGQ